MWEVPEGFVSEPPAELARESTHRTEASGASNKAFWITLVVLVMLLALVLGAIIAWLSEHGLPG